MLPEPPYPIAEVYVARIFANLFGLYQQLPMELREGANEMIEIINSSEADEDEKLMAVHTLVDLLF